MDGREPLAGRYELQGLLGRGGMAEVHDGWDTRLNRAVAIKLLHPTVSTDADARRRFEDEARAAASLNHPNIVAVHDCGEHRGAPFIVMERLPGRTLADEIAVGPMPPQRVRAMLYDVLGALATAHRAGIVHRDVKPGNVLLTQSGGAVKVADFGIAKTAGAAHTAAGQIVGTMAYMSPERVAGAPASVADDLYAVGIVAYEALIGRRPYPQENPASLLRAILDGPPPPIESVRPDVDSVLAAVINAAVSRNGDGNRFGSAGEMRAALSARASAPSAGDQGARATVGPVGRLLRGPACPPKAHESTAETASRGGGIRRAHRRHLRTGARPVVDHTASGAGQQQHRCAAASAQFGAAVTQPRSGRRGTTRPGQESRRAARATAEARETRSTDIAAPRRRGGRYDQPRE